MKWLALLLSLSLVGCIPDLGRSIPGGDAGVETGLTYPDAFTQSSDVPIHGSDLVLGDAPPPVDADAGNVDGSVVDLEEEDYDGWVPDLVPPDAPLPDTGTGKWYQANSKQCPAFCSGKGLTNAAGPEGGYCMSGEVRAASGMAQGIKFTYGCWPNCGSPTSASGAQSQGDFCYRPGQKTDNDPSDRTVGCFCSP